MSTSEPPQEAARSAPPTSEQPPVEAPVTTVEASAKVSRAGRNLPAAIGVGLLLALLVVLSLFWHKQLFVVLATGAVCVGVWELRQALRHVDITVPLVPAVAGTAAMLVAAYLAGEEALLVTFALTCVLMVLWRASDGTRGAAPDISSGFFVMAYPGLLAGFSMLLLAPSDGAWRTFTFLAVTVASDVGGYAVGVLAGRHPIAPRISPKKSWEGFGGSVGLCAVVGVVCAVYALGGPWWVGLLLGVVAAVAATIGDLVESALKRDLGIKDMSNLLPGHGGMLDRLDSLLVTAPVVWAVLAAFLPVS